MPLTLITACTSRKSAPVPDGLRLRDVPKGPLYEVAHDWAGRINPAAPIKPARDLYAGRDYRRLIEVAGATSPFIVSAGLGLLRPETPVPAYDATVASGVEDSVFARATGRFSPRDWFTHLQVRSHYATSVKDLPRDGLILAALPARYLAMLADDLVRIGHGRVRLFTGSDRGVPDALLAARMPYDGLLADVPGYNGPLVGFADRALCHFLTAILPSHPDANQLGHHTAVRDALHDAFEHRPGAQ